MLASYQTTLQQQNHPMREFSYVHMARKVVGVGSVGTRAWIVLLRGRDDSDPLLLQAKQAEASVLERFLPPSEYDNHGERVVRGQRLMQAASDIFLGWQRQAGIDGVDRDFYIRQLHDWKGSADVDAHGALGRPSSTPGCAARRSRGRTHVRATASRSPPTSATATASTARSRSSPRDYADQNERDYAAFVRRCSRAGSRPPRRSRPRPRPTGRTGLPARRTQRSGAFARLKR